MFVVLGRAVWSAELLPTVAACGRRVLVRISLATVALVRFFVPYRDETTTFAEVAELTDS